MTDTIELLDQSNEHTSLAVLSDNDLAEFYGTMAIRWYQVSARNQTYAALRDNQKRILIVLPTGAGKTLTIACTLDSPDIRQALNITEDRPLRVLFVSHRHRLLTQAEQTFVGTNGVDLMLQSLMSDIDPTFIKKGWDVCVLDEAHHEACTSFQMQLEQIGNQPLIGLTATPDRAGGELIKFDVIINPLSREQAVREGWLAETHIHSIIDTPSRDKIHILTDLFLNYGHEMGQTMVFVRTKAEVQMLALILRKLGYNAVGLLNQSASELNAILNDFSVKKVQFILNCRKIGEGVDVKGCTSVVAGRQFGSYPDLNQVIGRAARPDSPCNVWELISPLSGKNLDTTCITGTPASHRLLYKKGGNWTEKQFEYVTANDDIHVW